MPAATSTNPAWMNGPPPPPVRASRPPRGAVTTDLRASVVVVARTVVVVDADTVMVAVATARDPPLRLIVCPVNTWRVDVPPELVTVNVTVYVPAAV